jgi:hypothetical protein
MTGRIIYDLSSWTDGVTEVTRCPHCGSTYVETAEGVVGRFEIVVFSCDDPTCGTVSAGMV